MFLLPSIILNATGEAWECGYSAVVLFNFKGQK